MLSLILSPPLPHGTAALRAVANSFHDFFAVVREANATAARFETLAHLSDAELARRGLTREGLAQAVIAEDASLTSSTCPGWVALGTRRSWGRALRARRWRAIDRPECFVGR